MRYISTLIQQSLKMFPAVLLLGARQIGKSTLAQELVTNGTLNSYKTLDDASILQSATHDPDGFVENIAGSATLDEIQRAPDLMRALKKNIDENRKKGRFLLTGSANVLAHPEVAESLAGRIDIFILEGLSVSELQQRSAPRFYQILLQESKAAFKDFLLQVEKEKINFSQSDLLENIFFGGFPEVATTRDDVFHQRYFQAYLTTYVDKDVRDLSRGIDIVQFGMLAKILLSQSGFLLNIKSISNDLELDQRTVKRYIELMDMTFQTIQLHPWHRNNLKKLIKTPKIYAKDSGIVCAMKRILHSQNIAEDIAFGTLLETFFFAELRKQVRLISGATYFFYRSHSGKEVDFVLEYGDKTIGIELKAASSVHTKDFSGLKDLQEANKGHLDLGIVFYQGNAVVYFSENLVAIPIKYALLA